MGGAQSVHCAGSVLSYSLCSLPNILRHRGVELTVHDAIPKTSSLSKEVGITRHDYAMRREQFDDASRRLRTARFVRRKKTCCRLHDRPQHDERAGVGVIHPFNAVKSLSQPSSRGRGDGGRTNAGIDDFEAPIVAAGQE